jgi:hypothetical protein
MRKPIALVAILPSLAAAGLSKRGRAQRVNVLLAQHRVRDTIPLDRLKWRLSRT